MLSAVKETVSNGIDKCWGLWLRAALVKVSGNASTCIDEELGGEHSSLEEHQVLRGEYLNLAFSKERTEVCMSGRRGAQKIRKARGI